MPPTFYYPTKLQRNKMNMKEASNWQYRMQTSTVMDCIKTLKLPRYLQFSVSQEQNIRKEKKDYVFVNLSSLS